MRRGYNPYLLPPWLRKTRFYCKGCIIPLTVFQLIRLLLVPTTGDFLVFCLLAALSFCFYKNII
ncbi:hypothetical protein CSV65_01700 [Sporosarcina sp. P31]|nr:MULTISPECIES: hypothetical protein [unclassified Sporosarcina]PIC98768.1 hypothetical protein CSV68_11060 [Sporosarcina sp. P29]PID07315.1 hypothetical protein CSV66_01695 [Sporosarcina sp. P30]PID10511.1 hypothetical protein CSV65_01700 [Sporosarcina sp. P31]PID13096.1 hypothetical protein CSV64_04280 [Sporosarcina sp. P32b]